MESGPIGGKYEIIKKIGEGGAADVFLAEDLSAGRKVALKIPNEDDNAIYESIKNEYFFAARHRHPSLLRPIEICHKSEMPILVSPYLEGTTLDNYADRLKNNCDPEKYILILGDLFAEILECADFIHFSKYCYNDFKPANVICRKRDKEESGPEIALIDFNLVTPFGGSPGRRGTLQYLAPEIITGDSPSMQSDIYSIGVLFYQILTGRLPFDGENSADFINNILDTREVNFAEVPGQFWDGLTAMLEPNPSLRPSDCREAARELGVDYQFDNLSRSRIEYYISSGEPPFARELKSSFEDFIKANPKRLFYLKGYSYGPSCLDFLESECNAKGFDCVRIDKYENSSVIKEALDELNSTAETVQAKKAVLIENLEALSGENHRQLAAVINYRGNVVAFASTNRWHHPEIKHEIFDPIRNRSETAAAEISIKSFLKLEEIDLDCAAVGRSTGGDPEQVFSVLKNLCITRGMTCRELAGYRGLDDPLEISPENKNMYHKMHEILSQEQKELISVLSAWGDTIPLLLFVKFEEKEHKIVQELIRSGHFIRQMDSISFFCGGFRDYVYDLVSDVAKREYHKTWAIAAEELICDGGERLELTARHWALSGDRDRAYRYNDAAAREFYRTGNYFKALEFGKTTIQFSDNDPDRLSSAFKINGDLYRAMGYFRTAREMYLKSLLARRDKISRAGIYRRLAGLYLEVGNWDKANRYAEISLSYYESRGDGDKMAACREIIISSLWGKGELKESVFGSLNEAEMERDRRHELRENIINEISRHRLFGMILDIAKDLGNTDLVIKALNEMGNLHMQDGDYDHGLRFFRKALESAEKIKNKDFIFESLMNQGQCHFNSGDIFMAIECFQNARESAEKSGNIYRKSLAELGLTGIALAMGNFALAKDVLSEIEKDPIYKEDETLRLQVNSKKLDLAQALGDKELSRATVEALSKSAPTGINPESKMLAEMAVLTVHSDNPDPDASARIKEVVRQSEKYAGANTVAQIKLLAGEFYHGNNEYAEAAKCFDEAWNTPGVSKNVKLHAAASRLGIAESGNTGKRELEQLIEVENFAATAGLIPLALKAAGNQGGLYLGRGRIDLYEECLQRSGCYLRKLLSALPEGYSADKYKRRMVLIRRPEIPDIKNRTDRPLKRADSSA